MLKPEILEKLRTRRLELGLTQADVETITGIKRQQYNRIENSGNPSLSTLDLLAKAMKSRLYLIPEDKIKAVEAVLNEQKNVTDNYDPWEGVMELSND